MSESSAAEEGEGRGRVWPAHTHASFSAFSHLFSAPSTAQDLLGHREGEGKPALVQH